MSIRGIGIKSIHLRMSAWLKRGCDPHYMREEIYVWVIRGFIPGDTARGG